MQQSPIDYVAVVQQEGVLVNRSICQAINRTVLLGLFVFMLPISVHAETRPIGWADIFSPQRLSKTLMVYGVSALRTVVDTTYGEIAVDLASGKVEISDLEFRPDFVWDADGSCLIKVPRATLSGQPLEDVSSYSAHLDLYNLSAPLSCLPMEARIPYMSTGKKMLDLPIISMGFDYDFPSGGMVAKLIARSPGIVGLEIDADLSYVSVNSGALTGARPKPVVFLRSASVVVENLGVWESVRELAPKRFVHPDTGAAAVVEAVNGDNRLALVDGAADEMIESFGRAWTSFLAKPQKLVVETGLDTNKPVLIDGRYDLAAFVRAFSPRFDNRHKRTENRIASTLVKSVLTGDKNVTDEQRALVGLAMLTGDGVPKNTGLGLKIVDTLPEDLAKRHAVVIARNLQTTDRQGAYKWALVAGALNQKGAMSLMLALEQALSFDTVLTLQREGAEDLSYSLSGTSNVADIRDNARSAFLGLGRKKDYYGAIYWATICAAAGDLECINLEQQINVKLMTNSGWSTNRMIQRARDAATADWVRFNLDTTL
jgi:hypothetical protein